MSDTDIVERLRRFESLSRKGKLILGQNFHESLLEGATEIEHLRAIVRNDQEFDKIEKTYIAEIERLRAGRAAVWAECRETCAKLLDLRGLGVARGLPLRTHHPLHQQECAMANEPMSLKDRLRNPAYVVESDILYLDIAKTRDDLDAAADRIDRLERALQKIQEPITVAADGDTVTACQDLHELISDIADEALNEVGDRRGSEQRERVASPNSPTPEDQG